MEQCHYCRGLIGNCTLLGRRNHFQPSSAQSTRQEVKVPAVLIAMWQSWGFYFLQGEVFRDGYEIISFISKANWMMSQQTVYWKRSQRTSGCRWMSSNRIVWTDPDPLLLHSSFTHFSPNREKRVISYNYIKPSEMTHNIMGTSRINCREQWKIFNPKYIV